MKLKGLLTDRKPLVEALEAETGEKATYSGAPSFRYQIGPYTILRDGTLETPEKDDDLISRLSDLGLIESGNRTAVGISFPTDTLNGIHMTNLVNSIAAHELLINRAIDIPNAFHMKADFVRELKAVKPKSFSDFMAVYHKCGSDKAMRGLKLCGGRLYFTGFPDNSACRRLAERMVETAINSQFIRSKTAPVVNDKYSFRVWLNTLGMRGKEYVEARAELLKNLSGDTSYRTKEQRAAYNAKRRKPEPDFVVL